MAYPRKQYLHCNLKQKPGILRQLIYSDGFMMILKPLFMILKPLCSITDSLQIRTTLMQKVFLEVNIFGEKMLIKILNWGDDIFMKPKRMVANMPKIRKLLLIPINKNGVNTALLI